MQKFPSKLTFLITCAHKRTSSRNVEIGRVPIDQKCHTHPLIASNRKCRQLNGPHLGCQHRGSPTHQITSKQHTNKTMRCRHDPMFASQLLKHQHFLAQCNSQCNGKHVCMDQGGELFNNPEVKNSFTKSGHTICPTGADASCQNGPVSADIAPLQTQSNPSSLAPTCP